MKRFEFSVGDEIEVIDRKVAPYPLRGKIVELDADHPLEYGEARIEIALPAANAPKVWVNLRLARKVPE